MEDVELAGVAMGEELAGLGGGELAGFVAEGEAAATALRRLLPPYHRSRA